MSRSNYSDDSDDPWASIMWRGAVISATNGARGQKFLHEMLAALDALPEHRLVAEALIERDGTVCAMGAVGKARGVDMAPVDPEDSVTVAHLFNIAEALAREIAFVNDEGSYRPETPEQRWTRMRAWVERQILPTSPTEKDDGHGR